MKNIRVLTAVAMFAAMSIVLGKYLAFPRGTMLRFSFENLPVILSGIAFGPVIGMVTGVVADLVGCFLVGYEINPIITLGAAVIGFGAGAVYKWSNGERLLPKVILCVLIPHALGSVIIKTLGLSAFYAMPIHVLMLWRLLNYIVVGGMECMLLYFILKNKAIRSIWIFNKRKRGSK